MINHCSPTLISFLYPNNSKTGGLQIFEEERESGGGKTVRNATCCSCLLPQYITFIYARRKQVLLLLLSFLLSSEGSGVDGEEVDTKQEVRGGGGRGGEQLARLTVHLAGPDWWRKRGADRDPSGKSRHPSKRRPWKAEGGLKGNSADISLIVAATQKLLPLSFSFFFASGGQRSRIRPIATTWWRLNVLKCLWWGRKWEK